jgi:hypothetical protein
MLHVSALFTGHHHSTQMYFENINMYMSEYHLFATSQIYIRFVIM